MTPNVAVQPRRFGLESRIWFFVAAAVLAGLLAVTARSLWIDECYTALIAQQPTLADWWRHLVVERCSDIAMPFYVFWIWLCEKIVGSSELALRAVNLFWFAGGLAAVVWSFAGRRTLQTAVFLAAVASPFAWYYLNEARSYTMQLNAGLILFCIVHYWWRNPDAVLASARKQSWFFVAALVLLCGSSLLSMILAAAPVLLVGALLPWKNLLAIIRRAWPVWLTATGLLLALGIYYLWTIHLGTHATPVAGADWRNPPFVAYELLGFTGLGPGRLEMRDGGLHVFKAYAVVLALFACVTATLLALALGEIRRRLGGRKLAAAILAVALPAGFLFIAAVFLHFRILGRHFAALAPVGFFLLGLGLARAWRAGWVGRMLAAVFFGLYLASALSVRFAHRHEKDDYRDAAAIARQALAGGKTVWWNADINAAIYYHVPLGTGDIAARNQAWLLADPSPDSLRTAAPPDVIIASRRDVYDAAGAVAGFLAREHYHPATNLMAFTIWERDRRATP